MVEFAFVAPVFFLIFFGIIEFALIMSSVGTFNFAARDAARKASILGKSGGGATTLAAAISVVSNHVSGLVMAQTQEVDIFRGAEDGMCLTAKAGQSASEVAIDDPKCLMNVYLVQGSSWTISWPESDWDDSLLNADYLGVRVKYNYTYLTGFIAASGSVLPLTAISIQRIEPQDFSGDRAAFPIAEHIRSPGVMAAFAGRLALALSPIVNLLPDPLAIWLRPRFAGGGRG
jgi:hypothetical protein